MTLLLRLVACLFLSTALAEEQNRFNVLFIAVDDLRPELGCYGVEHAQSPSLDAFAETAVTFRRHYVQVATCGSSRYALLTGRSPAVSGAFGNGAAYSGRTALLAKKQPGAQSFPELFRRSGYRTVLIGKISHTPDGRVFAYDGKGDGRPEIPGAWDELATPFGPWQRGWGTFFAYAGGVHREDGKGHRRLMEFKADLDDELPDGLMTDTALERLKKFATEPDQRFLLGLGYFKPHLPFVAPKQDWDAFDGVEIPLPPSGAVVSRYQHSSGEFYKYEVDHEKTRPLSDEARRDSIRAYLACVRYVDRQIGRVLAQLEESGLEQDTIVVVWGDHGWHLGEQRQWGKHTPFEHSMRSVLMVRIPGHGSPGLRTDALSETLDLYPTLLDACSPAFEKTTHPLDGRSLLPVIEGKADSVRDVATSYWKDAISLRNDRYRIVVSTKAGKQGPAGVSEIYDFESDNPLLNRIEEQRSLAERLAQEMTNDPQ